MLTHEQEISLAQRIQTGDQAAREELIENNMALVYGLARRYYTFDVVTSREDIIQSGMIGLITAVDRFNPEIGTRFSTYAVWWIRQAMGRAARTAGSIKRPANVYYQPVTEAGRKARTQRQTPLARLDDPLQEDGDDTLLDILPAPESTENAALEHMEVERVLSYLTLPHQRAIIENWMNGAGMSEASIAAGYSHSLGRMILLSLKERVQVEAV